MRETWVRSLGREDPLEKEMATHSSILAWRIPWTEEAGGLQSTGLQRVGHDWATSLHFRRRKWMEFKLSTFGLNGKVWKQKQSHKNGLEVWILSFLTGSMCYTVLQSCLTFCDPMDCSPPSSSVHGILLAILELVAMPSSRGSSWLRNWTCVSKVFPHSSISKIVCLQCRRDLGLIPGSGRSPGEENGNPFQYSCLENPMDRGAWQGTVYRVARVGHKWTTKHILKSPALKGK